jgi:phosphoglycerate dehydrogenase-like enzyme
VRALLASVVCLLAACASTPSDAARPNLADESGSLRNAVVATPAGVAAGEVVYFARGLSDADRAAVAAFEPPLRVVEGLTREEAVARAHEAHGIDAFYASAEFVAAAPQLTWVQVPSAGVDHYASAAHLVGEPRIVMTNMRAVHGPAIADHVFAMLLALTRDLPVHLAGRASGAWNDDGSGVLEPITLAGRTLLVVGLGGIGSEVAKRAAGFDMRVLATRRSGTDAPPFVERVAGPEALLELLPEADVVVVCVPLTPETDGLFDAAAFAAMKRGAYLVNIARGRVVDTAALVDALHTGRIAGACLDVTEPEPLPADHVLWTFPNVVITPHVAAQSASTLERRSALLVENLRRFAAGEPLLNVVDKRLSY